MFFDKDEDEEDRRIGFADLVNSINGNSNQISNKPTFAELVQSINHTKIEESNKKEKKEDSNRTVKVETLPQARETSQETKETPKKQEDKKEVKSVDTKQGANQNVSMYNNGNRNVQKTDMPTLQVSNEVIKGEKTSTQINNEINAIEESKQINKDIKSGGSNAINAAITNTLNNIKGGMMTTISGLASIATTIGASIIKGLDFYVNSDKLKKAYSDMIDTGSDIKSKADYTQKVNARIENDVVRNAGNIAHTISNVATDAAIGGAIGVDGTVIQGLMSGGNAAQEYLDEDKNKISKALLGGTLKGYVSYFTEKMFDANILTRGAGRSKFSVSNITDDLIYKTIKSKAGKEVANKLVGILGENAEEVAEARFDAFVDYLQGDKEFQSLPDWWKEYTKSGEAGETALLTTLSTVFMELLGMGGGTFVNKEQNILTRKAQEFMEKGGSKIGYDLNNKTNNQVFYASDFENGQLKGINAVTGKEINNPNSKVQVKPAIVLNDDVYNVIDSQTGAVLDSSPYTSLIQAETEFDKKMINLDQNQIDAINSEVKKAGIEVNNKLNQVVNVAEAQINADNMSKSTENNQTEQSRELANQTTNDMSENLKSLKNEPGKSNFVTDTPKTRIDNEKDALSIFKDQKLYDVDQIEQNYFDYQEENEIIGLKDSENYIDIKSTQDGNLEIGEYNFNEETNKETLIDSIILEPGKDGKISGKEINDAIRSLTLSEDNPIKGQLDIEGNQVYSEKKGVNKNGKTKQSTYNGQKDGTMGERKISREQRKNAKSNEMAKGERYKGLQHYQEQQQKRLGKDFKAEIVDVQDITQREKIIKDAIELITGLNLDFYKTNKSTTESAFYSANEIYEKHRPLVTKQILNHAPWHEYGHWLKDNNRQQWNKLYDIVNKTVTDKQINDYRAILNNQQNYSDDDIVNEIISDYFGNWANDIANWEEYLDIIPTEYRQILADIATENKEVGYNIFGTIEQQNQMYNVISDIMKDVIEKNNIIENINEELADIPKFTNRKDIDKKQKEEFHARIQNAILNKQSRRIFNFGIIDEKTANKIKKITGIDVSQRKQILLDNDIRHMIKQHSNKDKEAQKEQIAITYKDIELIPNVINHYDKIVKGSLNDKEQTVRYIKKIGKNKVYVVEIVPETKNNLKIKTMWIKPVRVINSQKTPNLTPKAKPNSDNSTFINNSVAQKDKNVKFNKKIQGLEDYNINELKQNLKSDIKQILEDNGFDEIDIVDLDLHGSRLRGTAKNNSDLDVVVQYKGDASEDTLFNVLNEKPIKINGIKVDINPIEENLKDYMLRSKKYDQEILSKEVKKSDRTDIDTDNKGRALTKEQQEYFKDSKVRDNKGNLMVMYHGTATGGFNIFDNSKGISRDSGFLGKGFYFTNDEAAANDYSDKYVIDEDERSNKPGEYGNVEVKKVYLNIKNPYIVPEGIEYGGNMLLELLDISDNLNVQTKLKSMGYDGIIYKNGDEAVAFYPEQIKNIDNKNPTDNPDIRYSDRSDVDNEGRALTEAQQEYFKDSKARDENGNLAMVYHTTTDRVAQFNEFNPTTTKYYRFGDQVVNYFTDSQDMSGSYADSKYNVADTTKIENITQAKKWINKYNNLKNRSIYNYTYDVEKSDIKGMVKLIQYERRANGENQKIGTYTDLKYKDLIQYVQMLDHNFKNIQYQGYLNITNPYIVDAEGKNWNKVQSNIDKEILSEINEIKKDKDKVFKLKNLQAESLDKYLDYISGYKTFYEEDIKDTIKDIGRGQSNDLKEALEYCMMFGFNFDEYVKSLNENYTINGNTKIKNIYDKYFKNHNANDIKNYKTKMIHFGDKTINDFLKKAHEYYTKDIMYGQEYSYFKENYAKIIGKSFYDYSKEKNITPENLYKIAKELFSKDSILEVLGENETTNDIVKQVLEMNKNGANYDGIIMKNVIDYGGIPSKIGRSSANLYVTFNSNQFKAKDNLNPSNDSDIRYSNRKDTNIDDEGGFYSQLANIIEQKMPNAATAQQIQSIINSGQVKQDELKWIGLDDYLRANSLRKITKQEVLDYIAANQINIETIEKGTSKLEEYTQPVKEDIEEQNAQIKEILDKYGIDYEEDDLAPYRRDGTRSGLVGDYFPEALEQLVDLNDFEKYEKQDDGSYLHSFIKDNAHVVYQFTEEKLKEDMRELSDLYELRSEAELQLSSLEDEYGDYADELGVPKYEQYALEGGENYREILFTVPKNDTNLQLRDKDNYKSPHWSEFNVIAHARTQDFEDINGNKVLFIDEIQSDMHQQGRKEGYRTIEQDNKIKNIESKMEKLRQTYNDLDKEYKDIVSEVKVKMIEKMKNIQEDILKEKPIEYTESILTMDQQREYANWISDISYIIEKDFYRLRIDIADRNALETRVKEIIESLNYLPMDLSKDIINKFKNKEEFYKYTYDFVQSDLINDIKHDFSIGIYPVRDIDIEKYGNKKQVGIVEKRNKMQQDFNKKMGKYHAELDELRYGENVGKISELFPFKKNWHEFTLRRLINEAVLNDYDEVAWTTGRQQRERYNLAKVIDSIEYYKPENFETEGTMVSISAYKDGKNVLTKEIEKEELADYIGKDLAMKIINSKDKEGTISNLDESINEDGNNGMYVFYDQEIPNYLNKYLKKWNSKVEEITLKDADGKEESKQPGFKITEEMKQAVKEQGQPLYSERNYDIDIPQNYTEEEQKELERQRQERLRIAKSIKDRKDVTIPGLTNAERADSFIEQEIQRIEQSGEWDNSIPPTSRTDIRKTIEDYLGLGIKRGKFRQRAYGIYKQGRDIIRVKEYKDIDNVLHETGHALDLGNRLKIDKETISDELISAVNAHGGYENESRTVKLDEGFAEIIREYSIVPEQAKIDYPQTVSVIEKIRANDKEFDRFITRLQNQTYNYIHQNPQNRVLSNISIGEETDKQPLSKEWIKQEVMRNVWDKDYALKSAVEELAKAGKKTTKDIKASQNAYYLTRLASGIDTKVSSILSEGYIDEKGNKIIPGLNQIGEILGNDPQRFNDLRSYLVAQRDLEYKAKTLKTGIRTMDSKSVVDKFKNDKQIQQAAKLVYDTLDGVMQYAVDNNIISQEEVNILKESNAFYVPMHRVLDTNSTQAKKRMAVSEIIKKRTGSELDVKDVLENIIANSANVIQQVENNNILKALYEEGEKSKLTGSIYDVIPAPMVKIGTAKLQTWQNELEKQGVDTSKIDFEKTIDLFSPNNKIDPKNLITSFINDQGQRVYMQFNDELIFNSIMNLDKQLMSKILMLNSKMNLPLRYGATMANLGFAIPNIISDTAQATVYSEAGFIPVVDNIIGIIDVLANENKYAREFLNKVNPEYAKRKKELYTLYKQSGANSSTRMSQYRKSTQEIMKDIYGANSKNLGIKEKYKPLKTLLNILTYIPELSEQSTRLRVFERNYEAYKNKGTEEMDARILAALESRDATQDFGRTGNITREINQLIPFSAARVGSAYTFAEKAKANPKRTAFRVAILMALAMAIKSIGYNDKEIEELNQRKKDDNFVIKIGDKVITIKKPQGILRSIINLEEYIQDLFTGHIDKGKEGEKLGEWINNAIMDNMPADSITGLVPNMVAPLIENAINKDLYYNTDIVKQWDLDLPNSQQYYEYTSQLAIWLGSIFNYSPAKIDNLISGYFAGLGTQTTNALDWVSGKLGLSAEKPNMGAEQDVVGKRFVVNVNNNSSSIDEVYNLKTELTKKQNGGTITEEESQKLNTINSAVSNISKINKQIKEIKKDLTTDANTKADQIRALQSEKTDIARQALGKEPINSSNKTNIESTEFYNTSSTLKKNGYSLDMTSDMKKEYEQIAYDYYKRYESQGLYNEEKLKEIKTKAKDYAKNQLFSKYKSEIYKSK